MRSPTSLPGEHNLGTNSAASIGIDESISPTYIKMNYCVCINFCDCRVRFGCAKTKSSERIGLAVSRASSSEGVGGLMEHATSALVDVT